MILIVKSKLELQYANTLYRNKIGSPKPWRSFHQVCTSYKLSKTDAFHGTLTSLHIHVLSCLIHWEPFIYYLYSYLIVFCFRWWYHLYWRSDKRIWTLIAWIFWGAYLTSRHSVIVEVKLWTFEHPAKYILIGVAKYSCEYNFVS